MFNEIETAIEIMRGELREHNITLPPVVSRAQKYIRYRANGEESESWYDVDFESIGCSVENFGPNASGNRWQLSEHISGEFMNADCETVRYSLNLYKYWDAEELDILRGIGKLIKVSEPATEYDALVC